MAERDLFLAALIKKGFDNVNEKIDVIASVVGEEASFASVKKVVAAGMAANVYPIGTKFIVPHNKYGNLIFDVVAHNNHKNPDNPNAPTMTLAMHNVIYGRPFDACEAAYCVTATNYPNGLPAGTHYLLPPSDYLSNSELEGWAGIQFTTSAVVPVGGQIVLGWTYGVKISAVKITTFASPSSTSALESNIVPTNGTDGTSLGTIHKYGENADGFMNVLQRLRYGNSNWKESNVRQWLNAEGDAGTWWTPTHSLDRLDNAYVNLEGFLKGIDADFISILGAVDVTTRKNNVFENDNSRGNITYTTRDKIFLLSQDEVGFDVEGVAQGNVLECYADAANADRIKYDYSSTAAARYWWLRSSYPGVAHSARNVSISGARYLDYADSGLGAAAACVIY